MSRQNTPEEKMEKQRKTKQREEQYGILTGLGWKSAGILLFVLIIAMMVYALFLR